MAPHQEDRGCEPEPGEIRLTGEGIVEPEQPEVVKDALGHPAAKEDDLGEG